MKKLKVKNEMIRDLEKVFAKLEKNYDSVKLFRNADGKFKFECMLGFGFFDTIDLDGE